MSSDTGSAGGKTGRPAKGEGPKVPYDEIDRLLVHGEVVEAESGGMTVVYPSYRELAKRYGCSHSLISQYAAKHNTMRRRRETKARVAAKADSKLVELRSTALAVSKDEALQIIDSYLAGFGKAIGEGRVRFDNPTDFNTMVRLKEFIQGGADSRQEIHAALSLEDIQARHQRMLKAAQRSNAAQRGEVVTVEPVKKEDHGRQLADNPPGPSSEAASQEVTVQQVDEQAHERPHAAHGGLLRARPGTLEDRPTPGGTAPHGPDVAPVGPPGVAEPGGER